MSLKASIVGLQVKQLKGALQYLAKIGEDYEVPTPKCFLDADTLTNSNLLLQELNC
jgi:hypothetical protein